MSTCRENFANIKIIFDSKFKKEKKFIVLRIQRLSNDLIFVYLALKFNQNRKNCYFRYL